MKRTTIGLILLLGVSCITADWQRLLADDNDDRPFGIDRRVPWTTSKIQGTPDPPPPYRVAVAFKNLKFNEPLDMTSAPGTDRLFVVERFGKIFSFESDPQTADADLLIDVGKVAYGLAFHPQFAKNGYFYVTYILDPDKNEPLGTRLVRYQVDPKHPVGTDRATEKILLAWPSGGHNGGCLEFGPDGYLYVCTGDSSGINDERLTGQDLGDFSGAILRIDVDREAGDKAYAIPPDNPFVGVAGAKAEVWAYGLRQPWKISFDRATGDLWTGNVGQDLWEQIFLIERGGNYGWSVMEGSHPFRPDRPRGPSPFVPPIVEHDHASFRSITGGFVYHGKRLKDLRGAYIYGDYDTGKIWMFRYDRAQKRVTENRELLDSTLRLVGFAEDHDGELYLVDHMGGRIHRLEPNPAAGEVADFPRKLSQTGLFASAKDHAPAPGVIPYDVNAPQWIDGAQADRFLALPGDAKIQFDGITYPQPAPGAPHGWKFPNGTVLCETISIEMEPGNPASRRRLETRVLHFEQLAGDNDFGDQFWRGYTYLWNDDQTDAVLLEDPQGHDRAFKIKDPTAPGGERQQTWHFPSRAECTGCHTMAAKYVLGVNTLQMNKDHDYGAFVDNQLRAFEHAGLFTVSLPARPQELPRLVDYRDESLAQEPRARAYLHANCSHCHRKWGGGNAEFLLLGNITREDMGIVGVRPQHGNFFIPGAEIVAPGAPQQSVLFYRMATLGPGHMPRLGSSLMDEAGLNLIYDWIAQLPSPAPVQSPSTDIGRSLEALRRGASADERQRHIDVLLTSTDGALQLMHAVDRRTVDAAITKQAIARATQHGDSHVRDLFERFLPEQQRTKRLGTAIRPEQILALDGDAARGQAVFFQTVGVQCKNCHRIGQQGTEVGPDLSQIGKKLTRDKILDNILFPSREIDPKFRVYLLETTGGFLHTGLLVEKDEAHVVLKTADNKLVRVAATEVAQLTPDQQSLMPDLLLRDMTAEQVADLLAYLSGLK